KTLARHTLEIGLARDGAIENRVAHDNVLGRLAACVFGLAHDDASAREALSDIIIGIADELEGEAARHESAKTLPGRAFEMHGNGRFRQAGMAAAPCDLA